MENIFLIILGACILWGIIKWLIDILVLQPIRDNAAKEVLKNFDIQKQKQEISAIKNILLPQEMRCPKCGGILVDRIGKFGRFFGCSNYPSCNFTKKKP
jgi:hypothetical protein